MKAKIKVKPQRVVERRAIPRGGRRATDQAEEEREHRVKQVVDFLSQRKSK
ncbi:MAG TPA: hypothetical protein VG222_02070 [Vicinamibacterales bacterium]|nr:hypothetical protein [Vicinamibacterales bacterium]